MYRLYLIENTVTGKRYVGVTTMTLVRRFRFHHAMPKSALYADLRFYGKAAFTIRLIETRRNRERAYARESELIADLGTASPAGYNNHYRGARHPGQGGAGLGNQNSRRVGVVQLSKTGERLREFPTIMDASKALGIDRSGIRRAVDNPAATAGGHKWRLL